MITRRFFVSYSYLAHFTCHLTVYSACFARYVAGYSCVPCYHSHPLFFGSLRLKTQQVINSISKGTFYRFCVILEYVDRGTRTFDSFEIRIWSLTAR